MLSGGVIMRTLLYSFISLLKLPENTVSYVVSFFSILKSVKKIQMSIENVQFVKFIFTPQSLWLYFHCIHFGNSRPTTPCQSSVLYTNFCPHRHLFFMLYPWFHCKIMKFKDQRRKPLLIWEGALFIYSRLRIKRPPNKKEFQILEAHNSKTKRSRTKLKRMKHAWNSLFYTIDIFYFRYWVKEVHYDTPG